MIEHLVFLLEEPSAQDFLSRILIRILPKDVQVHYMVFEGKQDLEKRLSKRMKGWIRPNTPFIVMRDEDSGQGKVIKARLNKLCVEAGQPTAIIRIACRELETFFVGDWAAVAEGFKNPALARNANLAKYRNPDLLGSPSVEIARVIKFYQKREGARKISPFLQFDKNKSNSFRVLVTALQNLFPS
ncbi:MAG: DUF4276 family protein [Oxalobacteraceae bacterium]|nr:DUF4276 family protein [Oxalobacteraceae bacterium]